mgnify:CR=1 FL=1
MVLIYSPLPLNNQKIDKTIEILKDRFSILFLEIGDFIFSTETNQKLLRDSILNNHIILVYIDSIKDLGLSPTIISELIIFLLNPNYAIEKLYYNN